MYAGIHENGCIHITFSSENVCRYACNGYIIFTLPSRVEMHAGIHANGYIFTLPSRVKMYAGIHASRYIHITFSSEDDEGIHGNEYIRITFTSEDVCMQMNVFTLPSQVKMYAGIHANGYIHITISSEDVCRYSWKWIYIHITFSSEDVCRYSWKWIYSHYLLE